MKIPAASLVFTLTSILLIASAFPQLHGQNNPATNQCDVRAYVLNGGSGGVNVRAGAGPTFKIAGNLPTQKVEGIAVHITGASGQWIRIDRAIEEGGATDRVLFSGSGWISSKLLGISGTAIDNGATNLYQTKSKQSAVVIRVPAGDDSIKVRGCNGRWMFVEYQQK